MIRMPDLSHFLSWVATFLATRATSNYLAFAFSVWVMYDHLITFDDEVARIWTLRWQWPKILFMVNRYVIAPLLFMNGVFIATYTPVQLFCEFISRWEPWLAVAALMTVELILIIRISALYDQSKKISWFLACLFACEMIAVFVNTAILVKDTDIILVRLFLPGCYSVASSNIYSFWIPFLIFEGIIIILTLYKIVSNCTSLNPTLRLLARDSIVYFIIMFTSLFATIISVRLSDFLDGITINASSCIACVAVSRMMVNLRGLTVDDPDGAETAELQTLEFSLPPVMERK